MICPYFQKHSGFTPIISTVFSSYKKKEKISIEYKCNLYVRFLLLTSYLPLYVVDTAAAVLAGHHHLLLKSILVILKGGLTTLSISR